MCQPAYARNTTRPLVHIGVAKAPDNMCECDGIEYPSILQSGMEMNIANLSQILRECTILSVAFRNVQIPRYYGSPKSELRYLVLKMLL